MTSGRPEDIVHQEGQTSENLQLAEKIAVASSSHEEDRNEVFFRVSATAEMIKQDGFEAYKLRAKPKAKLDEKMDLINTH
jgi:hypothetical protein